MGRKLTILAVVDVPDEVADRSDDALLDEAVDAITCWQSQGQHMPVDVDFLIVKRGVSDEAIAAGAEPEDEED
jgi:hypothetical protein